MEQKHQFVSLAATGRFTFTELCAEFRVSRKTGHQWVVRYRQEGAAGLGERSRRPPGYAHLTALRRQLEVAACCLTIWGYYG